MPTECPAADGSSPRQQKFSGPPPMCIDPEKRYTAEMVTSKGTMQGEFAGMPPSGKQAIWDAVHITRVRDGKLVEHWVVQDQLGMLQQLGFVAAPGAAETAR